MANVKTLKDINTNNNNVNKSNPKRTDTPTQPSSNKLWLGVIIMVALLAVLSKTKDDRRTYEDIQKLSTFHQYNLIRNDTDFVAKYSLDAPQDWKEEDKAVSNKIGITRCATTQYAVTTFFCGNEVAAMKKEINGDKPLFGGDLQQFKQEINYIREMYILTNKQAKMLFRNHITQSVDVLGHTWVIQSLPNGNFRMYQSYISLYTLHDYLEKIKHKEMTYTELINFLNDIEFLEKSTTWSTEVDDIYKKHFGVMT